MKKILFITFLISSYCLLGQNITLNKKINWLKNITVNNNNFNGTVFSFENASYGSDYIPLYSDNLNLSEYNLGKNVKLAILNISYQTITDVPQYLKKSDKIKSEIKLEQNVYKGRNKFYLVYKFYPFINNNGVIKKVTSFTVKITKGNWQDKKSEQITDYADNSVLNSGTWVKIGITESGIYKLTQTQLNDLGFSDINNVRVFGNDAGMLSFWNDNSAPDDLIENYIFKSNDYILFYAEGPHIWKFKETQNHSYFYRDYNFYSDTAYYFLTDKNTGFNNSIPDFNQSSSFDQTINTYDFYDVHEKNTVNLIHSGRIWLGNEFIYSSDQTINFNVPDIVNGANGQIISAFAARSPSESIMQVQVEDSTKNCYFEPEFGATTHHIYADYRKFFLDFNQKNSDVNVNLSYQKPNSSSNAWIDYLIINAKCNLKYRNQIIFQSTENIGNGKFSKFVISSAHSGMQIWDISNPTRPEKINYTISGTTASFKTSTESLKKFIAFNPDDTKTPILEGKNIGTIENQNLHNVSANTDMIIITHPLFESQANEIAQIHSQHDNLNCIVANTQEVYNEFSSGMRSAPGIRNFIKMVYDKTNQNLRYVLLFGDGSYDNIGNPSDKNPNFVPTYQTEESFNKETLSTTSDDFYSFMDEGEGEIGHSEGLDISVGRMTIKTSQEADVMVQKLETYYNPQNFGDWHNIITFAADDRDKPSDNFIDDAESLADGIDTIIPYVNMKKIYLDAYSQQTSANGQEYPAAVTDFNNIINSGALIVNYLGHGSEHALASESLVTTTSIRNWTNKNKLPLFITGTCEFSRFDNADIDQDLTSAGELILLNEKGGGIGLLTTARVTYAGNNTYINRKYYSYLFSEENGHLLTMGDAYMKAKNQMASFNKYLYAFLGDPAIRLQYPKYNVVMETLNQQDINTFGDTLKALDSVNITGSIYDNNNNFQADYNGILSLTYFDKKRNLKTLNNDGNGAMSYWAQFNKLFRGRATIKNGTFSIDFIIPKDIYYNFDYSKFSFYAQNSLVQAAGQNKSVVLGGVNPNAADDNIPPKIRLFMNDSNFVSGGITDPNPSVFAILEDNNGINTSSASIGHDISLTIDDNPNKTYSINEHYQADIDDFRKGTVDYKLFNLSAGNHTAKLKTWDIYNNSAQKSIEFVVMENNELIIRHLLNYPNPFTTNTKFFFEHNKPGIDLDILLQIYTVSGKVVKNIHIQMNTEGFRSDPIAWNGLDDYGKPVARGVYIYSLKIRTPNGKIAQQTEKLLILK